MAAIKEHAQNEDNPRVFFDIAFGDGPIVGRIVMRLFADVTPKTVLIMHIASERHGTRECIQNTCNSSVILYSCVSTRLRISGLSALARKVYATQLPQPEFVSRCGYMRMP